VRLLRTKKQQAEKYIVQKRNKLRGEDREKRNKLRGENREKRNKLRGGTGKKEQAEG